MMSPGSRAWDRYEQGSVHEYWMVDPFCKQAEFYRLMLVGNDGIFRSVVLQGLRLKVEWLWQDPLPPLMSVLRAWELVSPEDLPDLCPKQVLLGIGCRLHRFRARNRVAKREVLE